MIGSIISPFEHLCDFQSYRLTNSDSTSTLQSVSVTGGHISDMRSVDQNKGEISYEHVLQVALFPWYGHSKYQDKRRQHPFNSKRRTLRMLVGDSFACVLHEFGTDNRNPSP